MRTPTTGLRIDGAFEIVGNLGRDGVGSVYLARYKGDCLVAIKLLGSGYTEDRFLRECRVLMTLRHPAIVSAYTSGTVGGIHYLVMEYVEGPDAADLRRMRGGPLTLATCAELLLPIADALAYCHSRGIFHGDVCPKNILVQNVEPGHTPSAKLVDFGGSWRTEDDEDVTGTIVLPNMDFQPTERYSPSGHDLAALGETSDIYALAATAYYLTAGRGPAGKVLTIDERSGATPLEPVEDEAWNAVIAWALHPDPRQRLPSMSLFRSLLRAWLPDPSDRHDGSRFEPFWAQEPTLDSDPISTLETAPTEPIEGDFVTVDPETRREGWWFEMMLDSLPDHTGATGTPSYGATVARGRRGAWMAPLALSMIIAFVAGTTMADWLAPQHPATTQEVP